MVKKTQINKLSIYFLLVFTSREHSELSELVTRCHM